MKLKLNLYVLFMLFLVSCKETPVSPSAAIEAELDALTTNAAKTVWLEKLMEDDQKMRGTKSSEIMLKYGDKSKEYLDYMNAMNDLDALNLMKIEAYVKRFGHPDKNELGDTAAGVPWAVIHHANTYEERERNFDLMYQAFLDDNINDGALSMYLGRMHHIKFGHRHEMKSPYKGIDEINQLIKALGLKAPDAK